MFCLQNTIYFQNPLTETRNATHQNLGFQTICNLIVLPKNDSNMTGKSAASTAWQAERKRKRVY
jgi:hypothetical protein